MKRLGRQIIAELYECNSEVLNDLEMIQSNMVQAALDAGAEIREVTFHKFAPQGVSGVVIISESHLAIHTWPELGYAAVDVFTCGTKVDPAACVKLLKSSLQCKRMRLAKVSRGIF